MSHKSIHDGALGTTERLTSTLEAIQGEGQPSADKMQWSASLLLQVCDNVVDAAIDKMETSDSESMTLRDVQNAAVENTLQRSVTVVDKVTKVISDNILTGEGAVTVDAGNIRVKVQQTENRDVEGNFEVEPGCSLDFPAAENLFDTSQAAAGVQFKAVMYQPNMRPFSQGAAEINSKTMSFEFVAASSGHVLEVKDTLTPITITIPRTVAPSTTLDNETTTSFGTTYSAGGPIALHTVDIPEGNGLEVEVHCLGFGGMLTGIPYNCTLHVMITTTGLPEIEYNMWNCTLIQTVTLQDYPLTSGGLGLTDPWNVSNSVEVEGATKCFIDNLEVMSLLENGMYTSLRIGLREQVDLDEWNKTYSRTPNATFLFKRYSLSPTLHSCAYIKETDEESQWKKDGCQVSPASNATHTVCLCDHLTMFGAGFQIPMNKIDLTQSAFTKLHENPVVFAFMVCCLCIYLVVVLWARKADKRDVAKAGVTPLADNKPGDRFHYEVTVFTGAKSGAGTTARVSIIITGDHMDSGVRLLHDPKRRLFESGGTDSFLLTSPRSFGDLLHVRIWHNNTGKSPGWFLSRLAVKDLVTNKMFYFMANRWLAVEEDDGLIDRVIPVAGQSELTTFGHLFSTKTRRNLSDGHLWFSVFNRPVKSRFTRVQRVSCCLSLLFSAMMANIFFYNINFTGSGSQVAYKIGPISFSMGEIVIGIISSLMVFPANIIIVQIFRLSAAPPRDAKGCCSKKRHRVTSASRRDISTPDLSTQRLSLTSSLGSRELRNELDLLEQGMSPSHTHLPSISAQVGWPVEQRVSSPSQVQISARETRTILRSSSPTTNPSSPTTLSPAYFSSPIPDLATDPGYRTIPSSAARPMGKKKKKKFELPWQCLYVGWILLAASVGVAFWLTVEVAGQFGKTKATEWLVSMCISLIQDIFLTQPLKVLGLALFFSLLCKKPDIEEEVTMAPPLGPDEEWLHDRGQGGGEGGLNSAPPPGVQPLSAEELAAAREMRFKEIKMRSVIREIIIYIIFLNIVMLIAFGDRDVASFYVNKAMKDTFVEASYNGRMKFSAIKSREHFWNYTENVFIPSLFSETWYNGEMDVWSIKQNLLAGKQMTLVGQARLRQVRVTEEPCEVPDAIKESDLRCRRTYSFSNDEERDFSEGWIPANVSDPPDYTVWENSVWKHHHWADIDSFPYWGILATYKGGGYLAPLDCSPQSALGNGACFYRCLFCVMM
ncbi:polycystin-1-like protein 2 [Diadema setosum]|uniref:polycystin-1-like protein 2 n=1 Tax=Diadema setosum TaxID=31175 RepID=UPI003B3AF5D0